jgi:hypothetical protein
MNSFEQDVKRSDLIKELNRMKDMRFFIVDEAFEIASTMEIGECGDLTITAVAFIASEQGYASLNQRLALIKFAIKVELRVC